MPLQEWIHHWEEGRGAAYLKIAAAFVAFLAIASLFDLLSYKTFSSDESMETAQLARNISAGKGYTTDSIRPVALYLVSSAAETGQSSKVLAQRVPDLSNPPVYPYLLAGVMKVLPFKYARPEFWAYQPERWITLFNQVLLLTVTMLLFFLARRLFDHQVAWLSAILFAGTRLFWRFSNTSLSTIWLMLVFLAAVWFMTVIEKRDRETTEGGVGKSIIPALLVGLLVGIGGLTRYSFMLMILPVLLFVWLSVTRGRIVLCLAILVAFAGVVTPWLARNYAKGGNCFGTQTYALAQGTETFPDDTLERSTDPRGGLRRMMPAEVFDKFLKNARDMVGADLPEFGGNWISAFFLAGLLVPFRNVGLTRLRRFLVGSVVWLFILQAFGQTHVSADNPHVNSENLLILAAPLVFVYGVAFFYTLLDQLNLSPLDSRGVAVVFFAAVLSAPLLFGLLVPSSPVLDSPYSPRHIQQTAGLLQPDELMMSDIPSAVAWYGGRSCVWLPLDDDREFFKVNALKPVRGLFLTQATTDKRFLSQMDTVEKSWGHFILECTEQGEVPTGFPLRKAPRGFLPDQLFLSDKVRWQAVNGKP
jgi:4-amino-4-deoxy-L-arabinose transferase-like glycosyltransferase